MNARDELADTLEAMDGMDYAVIADMILKSGFSKPRTITTVEEVYALADGAVVIDSAGDVSEFRDGFWFSYETSAMTPQRLAKYLPATVIHEADAK